MSRFVKVFVSGNEQEQLSEELNVVEPYEGFLLVSIDDNELESLSKRYPVEDISNQYKILGPHGVIKSNILQAIKGKYKASKRLGSGVHHYLVQFIGPVKKEWLSELEKKGGKIQSAYGGFTYVVRADDKTLESIQSLPCVHSLTHLNHSDRVAPSVSKNLNRKADDTSAELPRTRIIPGQYIVQFFDLGTLESALDQFYDIGFEAIDVDKDACVVVLQAIKASGGAKRIKDLSAVHGVKSIREGSIKRTSNDLAPRLMGAQSTVDVSDLNLDGTGEVVAVCDTGLDTGVAQTIHPDFKGRIKEIFSYPIVPRFSPYIFNANGDDGAGDFDSGHGTHVAGSVLGDGNVSSGLANANIEGPIRGLAHKAKLVFQAVEQEMQWRNPAYYNEIGRYLLSGIPNNLYSLFADAYGKKARIHSNSWGGGDPGAYDSQCEQLDRFVWDHKDFCVLVAAGNDGTDVDGDGKINLTSVTSPATAKNCITVGASENDRADFNHQKYGNWWPSDYPVAPYQNAPMADNPDQVVAFSSRGPTNDGRIRPDVVAPGTFVLSARSTMISPSNNSWAAFPSSKKYFYMGGTSMATPLAAGAVTLIRQYLKRDEGFAEPSASLLKAAVIAGSQRLPNVSAHAALFDNHQGFGRISLDTVLNPQNNIKAEFVDVTNGLETGEIWSQALQVNSANVPLRVVMAYTDFPGEQLINNLNLILKAPDGTRYVGNAAAEGGLILDANNNVEVIQINIPVPGLWKIEVVASNVPESKQDFSVVVLGAIGHASDPVDVVEVETIVESSSPDLAIPDNDSNGVHDNIQFNADGKIIGIAVDLDLRHTYIGDLIIRLIGPDGTTVLLHNRSGASAHNINKRYESVDTDLKDFVGKKFGGEWKLHIADNAGIDTGTLNNWSIEIHTEPQNWVDNSSNPSVPIPDNNVNGIDDTISVVGVGNVAAIEVWVDITHTWIGDLKVSLTNPSGTSVDLHDRAGGSRDNLITDFTLDNLEHLGDFLSKSGVGDWTLSVADLAGRDVGKLNAWGLRLRLE